VVGRSPAPARAAALVELLEPRTLLSPYGELPLSFEANAGQSDSRVQFLSRGSDYTLYLTSGDAVLDLQGVPASDGTVTNTALHIQLVGANPNPQVVGLDQQPGKAN
jgi:hypothetical protein